MKPLRMNDYDKAMLAIWDGEMSTFTECSAQVPEHADALLIEAEGRRDLRMVKAKSFRTQDGCCDSLTILTLTSTAKKHHVNPFHAILLAVTGMPCFPCS